MTSRRRTVKRAQQVTITQAALASAEKAAWAALPFETGGILIGWRHEATVHIVDTLEVADGRAESHTYRRIHSAAQKHLDAYLAEHDDPHLGYIGEWHTHPRPQSPSPLDLASLRSVAQQLTSPIALLVVAVDPDRSGTTAHVRIGGRARFNRVTVTAASLDVLP
ncbi:Mov34/MPN/PAD-1 family protein [Rhodococcus aetherivorans]|uniref:Mov34/MPN/PAD-1 family protein n=1 Tax=Rhodococcus aetherivorans TaxID=191292 RepID=UPI00163A4D44|nr:Mov34/MPN/PAD-1 family protein [Rhodococcus aetherivorans]MBC2592393.1 Mov34/MPN/PAD-1 family protein [Rhodococcus aetherivorans]